MAAWETAGAESILPARSIDGQPIVTTEVSGLQGLDSGKFLMGYKRQVLTDTSDLLLTAWVHANSLAAVSKRRLADLI